MDKSQKKFDPNTFFPTLLLLLILFMLGVACTAGKTESGEPTFLQNAKSQSEHADVLHVLASSEYEKLHLEDYDYNYPVEIIYKNDIDAIQAINRNKNAYDALLISNSMWTYMLEDTYMTESKSLAISPVVFAVKKEKAEELGLIGKEIETHDIIELLKNNSLTLAMPSPVRTNVGATAYLSIIESLSGNPEVLTPEDLDDEQLKENIYSIFNNVERNSGSEEYLFNLIETDQCDTIVASEASIVQYNHGLLSNHSVQPLYILYPKDGVGINDTMLTFIGSSDKKNQYLDFKNYLIENQELIFGASGYRTWYGGTTTEESYTGYTYLFDKEHGIDPSKVLKITNFPSKSVMNKAFDLYIDTFRKQSAIMFVLDYSGSMQGRGYEQLNDALDLILHQEKSSQELLQFSPDDKIGVIYFNDGIYRTLPFISGDEVDSLYDDKLAYITVSGGTPLYEALFNAYQTFAAADLEDYNRSIILMTDGQPTGAGFDTFKNRYEEFVSYDKSLKDIPVYTIAFGNASLLELKEVAKLTNGKDFDGRENLTETFKEIRGYN